MKHLVVQFSALIVTVAHATSVPTALSQIQAEMRGRHHPPFSPLRSLQGHPQAPHAKNKFLAIIRLKTAFCALVSYPDNLNLSYLTA